MKGMMDHKVLFEHEGHVERVRERLSSRRYIHTLGVVDTAIRLGRVYDADEERLFFAALYHDYAKHMDDKALLLACREYGIALDVTMEQLPMLAHGFVAAAEVELELGIKDPLILDAMRYHTIGREEMTLYDKIIYLADAIEPGRDYPGVDRLRKIAGKDIDEALIQAIGTTVSYVLSHGTHELVHPNSILLRNLLIIRRKENG